MYSSFVIKMAKKFSDCKLQMNLCLPKLVTVRMLGPYPTDADGVARITKADSTEFFPIAPPDHARKLCGGRRPPPQL